MKESIMTKMVLNLPKWTNGKWQKRAQRLALVALLAGTGTAFGQSAGQVTPSGTTTSNNTPKPATPASTTQKPASVVKPGTAPNGKATDVQLQKIEVVGVAPDQNILPIAPTSTLYGFDTSPQDSPRTISQVTKEQFEDNLIQSPSDLVYYAPGVTPQNGGGVSDIVLIRGQRSSDYIDGFLTSLTSHEGLPFNFNAYDSADIVSGPAPVNFGSSNYTSGFINFLTKQPFFDKNRTVITTNFGDWVQGGGSYSNYSQQIDNGGPISKTLAYRVSLEKQEASQYFPGGLNDYNSLFGALSWIPNKDVKLDWNLQYQDNDYNEQSGWNRVNQSTVNNGSYIAGPPINVYQAKGGALTYAYSQLLNSSGQATGLYQLRTLASSNATAGTATGGTAAAVQTALTGLSAGTLGAGNTLTATQITALGGKANYVGSVLDYNQGAYNTTLDPNQVVTNANSPYAGSNLNTQLNFQDRIDDDFTIQNQTMFEHHHDEKNDYTGFTLYDDALYIENKTNFLLQNEVNVFGLNIKDQSISGVDVRYENVDNSWGGSTAQIGAFDLAGGGAGGSDVNALFGGKVVAAPTGLVTGTQAVLPLNYTNTAYWYGNVPVGTAASTTVDSQDLQVGLFSQHNIQFDDQWSLNAGGRVDFWEAEAKDPLTVYTSGLAVLGSQSDSTSQVLPNVDASLLYKPVSWVTNYLTFDYSQAYNGLGVGWITMTKNANGSYGLLPANFHSANVLYEAGSKLELVPNKLFATVAGYDQSRNQLVATGNPTTPYVQTPINVYGVDTSLRYQPDKHFNAGVNFSWLNAFFSGNRTFPANPYGQPGADNASLFNIQSAYSGTATAAAGYGTPRNVRVPWVPNLNLTFFTQYQLDNGLGAGANLWAQSSQALDTTGDIIIPAQYNLNLNVFYDRPNFRIQIDFMNVTNQLSFADVFTPGSSQTVTPNQPFSIAGTVKVRF